MRRVVPGSCNLLQPLTERVVRPRVLLLWRPKEERKQAGMTLPLTLGLGLLPKHIREVDRQHDYQGYDSQNILDCQLTDRLHGDQ
jgi:hypothetical protein